MEGLEKCTDVKCKDNQKDIECLNRCGTEFMKSLDKDFNLKIQKYGEMKNMIEKTL